jgi:hypothetical protein
MGLLCVIISKSTFKHSCSSQLFQTFINVDCDLVVVLVGFVPQSKDL